MLFHQLGNKEAESPLLCSPCLCHAGPISIFNLLRWGCVLPSPHDPGAIWASGHLRTSIVGPSVPAVTIVVASSIVRISLAASCVLTFQQLRAKPLWFPRIHPPVYLQPYTTTLFINRFLEAEPSGTGTSTLQRVEEGLVQQHRHCCRSADSPGTQAPPAEMWLVYRFRGLHKKGSLGCFPIGCSVLLSQR